MNKRTISIIIPVYNHAHTLKRCFDSIFKQTYRPLEVVVVNDGSTDNFSSAMKVIMKNRLAQTLEINISRQENQGAPAARNAGFRQSRGEYIIFWDADTVAEPAMLEKMADILNKNESASYVYSGFKFGWKKFAGQKFDASQLKRFNYIDTTSLLRRDDFLPFDESLKKFQDWDLWLSLLKSGKTGIWLPEILYKKIIGRRKGISSWLPKVAYRLPWKFKKAVEYETARDIIKEKHNLI